MPVFPNKVQNLQQIGPIIEVILVPPPPVIAQLKSEGKKPPSKKVIALIDTGASGSCINEPISKELGLIVRDIVPVQTPSGTTQQGVFDVGFLLILPRIMTQPILIQALGSDLKNQPYQALIGRDILSYCTLIYNGWDNSYQLHI